MNHLDFLDTAQRLLSTKDATEADIRSAISRSYYAVYHHVLLWWKSNTRFPDYKDRAHAKIQMAIFNSGISLAKNFSKDLKELNINRRKADYEMALNFSLKTGRVMFSLAHNSITNFDEIDKIALAEGIECYLSKTNQI